MKDQILKIAGVKSEKEFYKKYPTEEAFMAKHGKAFKKAAMGANMVKKQLNQLTDWANPPQAQDGSWITGVPALGTSQATFNPDTGLVDSSKGFVTKADTSALGFGKSAPGNSSSFSGDAFAAAGLQGIGQIIGGVEKIGQQKRDIQKQEGAAKISGLVAQAAGTRERVKNKYVRPEDTLIQPGQLGSPTGVGTNYLAQNGTMIGGNPTEIQNTYNPGNLYNDLGYEPLGEADSQVKQFRNGGYAEFGDYFQDSGQAEIGSSVGGAIGAGIGGPAGQAIGSLLGKVAGNLFGGAADANKMARLKQQTQTNQAQAAFQSAMQGQFSANMQDGGQASGYEWTSHTWQPQVIASFGEHKVSDLLQPPHDADMLRAGGHLKFYTPPSASAMFTGRGDIPKAQFGIVTTPLNMIAAAGLDTVGRHRLKNMLQEAPQLIGAMNTGGRLSATNMMFDRDYTPSAQDGTQMALGGDLHIYDGGYAEPLSQNPYLPDGGKTVMFRGKSHAEGGIDITYGQNPVEVERGEPAVKLQDGGNQDSMVVFGNMKISKMAADHIGNSDAIGKKYKNFVADLSKKENKQNNTINRASKLAINSDENSPFDQLSLNSAQASIMGANMHLKNIAEQKQKAASIQNAILDTANQLGVKSDALAEGRIEKETDARMGAQDGTNLPSQFAGTIARAKARKEAQLNKNKSTNTRQQKVYDTVPVKEFTLQNLPFGFTPGISAFPEGWDENQGIPSPAQRATAFLKDPNKVNVKVPYEVGYQESDKTKPATTEAKLAAAAQDKTSDKWTGMDYLKMGLSQVAPFLRPTNQRGLDPTQTYPEMLALATNQLQPIKAQTFQPMLDTPYDISLQDQINVIDSQSRAAIRAMANDPSAQAAIMANAIDAKNRVLGEQFRMNQANKAQVYAKNRDLMNQAQLQNLQILDTQFVRQSQAASNTRAQAIEAAKSIAAKTLQNQLENRQLGVMENLYNYRFTPSGVAYNVNEPQFFNIPTAGSLSNRTKVPVFGEGMEPLYNDAGQVVDLKKAPKNTARNGSIVKALKKI